MFSAWMYSKDITGINRWIILKMSLHKTGFIDHNLHNQRQNVKNERTDFKQKSCSDLIITVSKRNDPLGEWILGIYGIQHTHEPSVSMPYIHWNWRPDERERERERSNSKTLILKDSSVRSIWTYLTASPCYTTNTNKHDNTTKNYYKHD